MFGRDKFRNGHRVCEVSVVTVATGSALLGAMATGALIGGGYEAITGGSVLKGVLGGAALGAAGYEAYTALAPLVSSGAMDITAQANFGAAVNSSGMTTDSATLLGQNVASGALPVADATAIANGGTTLASGGTLSGLTSAGENFLKSSAGQDITSALINGVSTAYAARQAGRAAGVAAQGALNAGGILATGATQAANIQSQAAKTAAGQAVAGQQQAMGTVQSTLAGQTALDQPAISAGTSALQTLSEGLAPGGQFNRPFTMADAQNSPAYQFALQQGQNQVSNSAGAGGTQLSAGNVQNLTTMAEGTAAQYQNQAFNQWLATNNQTLSSLQNMVQTGQMSTQQLSASLAAAGVDQATIQQNIGNLTAGGTIGSAQAVAGGVTGAAGAQAAGVAAAAGANAAGITNQANIIGQGVTNVANNLTGITAASKAPPVIPAQPPLAMSSASGLPTAAPVA